MSIRKTFNVIDGVTLILDQERSPFRYHEAAQTHQPTATLYFRTGCGPVTQAMVTKAAHRVMESAATQPNTQIQLSTTHRVTTWTEAMDLCDAFAEELKKLLKGRERAIAKQRQTRGAAERSRAYVNTPQ